ncbi:hypothetical protein M3231_06515 [Neobacillus mesonae]|nr:hypothetical protein [Neobacillus mesonae]
MSRRLKGIQGQLTLGRRFAIEAPRAAPTIRHSKHHELHQRFGIEAQQAALVNSKRPSKNERRKGAPSQPLGCAGNVDQY